MGRYDGEYYASRPPCPEGKHQRAFNGSCHVCKILCTSDGLSLAERERRDLRAENERLRDLLVQANEAFDEVTGDYAKGLVDGEPWRQYATVEPALSGGPQSSRRGDGDSADADTPVPTDEVSGLDTRRPPTTHEAADAGRSDR